VKFVATGDLHWCERSRLPECERIHAYILELLAEHKPDGFLCGGDVYDAASTPRERGLVARFFQAAAQICPVLIVKGNHDRPLDCALLARLKSKHPIVVEEGAGIHKIGNAALAAVAWPERQSILAWSRARALDPNAVEESVLQNILRGLGAELRAHAGPKLALGHFMVDGAKVSTGQPLLGQPLRVSLSDLSLLQAPVVLMSHVHKPQAWSLGNMQALYLGSPYRTSFGEVEDKSVTLVEFEGDTCMGATRLPLPCASMALLEDEWTTEDGGGFASGCLTARERLENGQDAFDFKHAEIRFRYIVDADQRDAAHAAAEQWRTEWLQLGAAEVQLDPCVRTSVRARAPEVAKAVTLPDKLAALWNARGTMPEAERQARLFELAGQLESTE
jgi:DNA repair exonuclease SbcCD nuclease subunit